MKTINTLFLLIAMLFSSSSLFAHDFEVDGIYYNITSDTEMTVVVTYKGKYYESYDDEYSGSVSIPGNVTYEGSVYRVTSIGNSAFSGCSGLTSVSIGNSVTSIGHWAFERCSGLTSITIPNSVTSIGGDVFSGCSGLTSIVVNKGNSVYDSRNNCNAIIKTSTNELVLGCKTTKIPNSVTSIGGGAFSGCSCLTSIEIPNSVTTIKSYAFRKSYLRTIVCLNPAPISLSTSTSDLSFETNTFNHATLYVPEGSYWDYAYSSWGSFIHMKEMAMKEDALESRKAYMIADASGCNYTVYDAGKDELVNVEYTFALDEENEGSCWTVMKEGEKSYLYNIGAKKFADMDEEGNIGLSDAPVVLDISTTESGLSINGKARMFVLNDKVDVDVTAINDVLIDGNAADRNAPVYNLQGMKMKYAENLPKGIYVKNGKKFLVK